MKPTLLLTTAFAYFFCLETLAQTTTLDISGGYSLPIASSTEPFQRNVFHDTSFPFYYTTSAKVKSMSYGKGGTLALNLNWYSKKDIGFGFKLNLLVGTPFNHSEVLTDLTGDKYYYQSSDKALSFQFIPHLCFKRDYKIVSPVLEAGMIIGMAQVNRGYVLTYSKHPDKIESNLRDYGNVLLGFYSSVGLSFNVSKVVKINLALNCLVSSYSPSSWKRTKFEVDGVDRLSALSVSDRQGQYVKELDLTVTQNTGAPGKDLKYSVPLSNVGITAGLCFKFVPKQKKKVTKKDEPNVVHPF